METMNTETKGPFEIGTDERGRRVLTCYRGKDPAPELPEGIEAIGDYVFFDSDIVSVRIPDSVKEIGQGAFMWCSDLTEVRMPEGIRLGTDAFADAPGVPFSLCVTDGMLVGWHGVCPEELVIPEGVRSVAPRLFKDQIFTRIVFPEGLTSVGAGSFVHCEYLSEVVLPDSVKRIGDCAFAWCHPLTKVSLPKRVRMGAYAFADVPGVPFSLNVRNDTVAGWSGDIPEEIVFPPDVKRICCSFDTDHIRRIVLPESLVKIYGGAFENCANLVSAAIPDTVKEIDERAFAECVSLTDLSVPRGAKIGEGAFRNVPGAEFSLCIDDGCLVDYNGVCPEFLTLPPEVHSIDGGAFSECPSLVSLAIPEGVREIGRRAFSECPSLVSAAIPDTVKEIDDLAFADCVSLTDLSVPRGAKIGEGAFRNVPGAEFSLCIADGVLEGYRGVCPEKLQIPEEVKAIRQFAFSECPSLEEIRLPGSVREIGYSAFAGCSALRTAELSKGVSVINFRTFEGCSSLASVVIPEGVREIGWEAFRDCRSLVSLAIPDTVKGIDPGAFADCRQLTGLSLPEGVRIGKGAFRNVPGAEFSLRIRDGHLESYNGVCPERLQIPEGVKAIREFAFSDCPSLEELRIPGSVRWIGYRAFIGCAALRTAELPDGISVIDLGTFDGCSLLASVAIPEGVREIGLRAFADCRLLREIYIPGSVEHISDAGDDISAFSGCESLTIVTDNPAAIGYAEKHGLPWTGRRKQ